MAHQSSEVQLLADGQKACGCHDSSKGTGHRPDCMTSRLRYARPTKNGADQSYLARLFKFPQMDFEMAIWEIMSLIIAPKKVFRQIYYHVCIPNLYCVLRPTDHV